METDSSKKLNNVLNYGWKNTSGPHSCNYITPKVIEILHSYQINRIADVGSGNGTLCGVLKKEMFDVVGVEYDVDGYNISVKKYPDISFYNLGVESNPLELLECEESFDAVISTEVIEHLYSPHLLPIFAKCILKKDGFLILSTPYHGYLKNLFLALFNVWDKHHTALWHGGHIKFWSKRTLTNLLNDNGFNVIGFHGVGRFSFLWKSMILVAKKV